MVVSIGLLAKKYRYSVRNVAMVLVAAVALGSSTYAWFANNTKVTADGLRVTAQSAAALSIKRNVDSNYASSIKLGGNGTAITNMKTVTLIDMNGSNAASGIGRNTTSNAEASTTLTAGHTVAFYSLTDANKVENPNSYEALKSPGEAISDTFATGYAAATSGSDYFTDTFDIKYTGESTADVKLTMTVTRPADLAADDFLHVAFVDASGKVWNYDVTNFTQETTKFTLDVDYFITGLNDTAKTYSVNVWFEGEDDNCTTANAVSTQQLSVALEFNVQT